MSNCNTERKILEARPGYTLFGARTSAHANDLGYGIGYGKYSNDEVQKIVLVATGGTWPLTFSGQTTSPELAYNATKEQVLHALEDLSNVLIGDIEVTGGPANVAPLYIKFRGQFSNTDVALMTSSTTNLTGAGKAVTISEDTKGGLGEEYLVVLQKNGDTTATLYSVDPATGVFTSVATGLQSSNWYFLQFQNRIYGINTPTAAALAAGSVTGMIAKTIGTSANAVAAFSRPRPPSNGPTAVVSGSAYSLVSTTGLTIGGYAGWATTDPTSVIVTGGAVVLTLTANQTDKLVTVDFIYAADQDYSLNDFWFVQIGSSSSGYNAFQDWNQTSLTLLDATPTAYVPPFSTHTRVTPGGNNSRYFHFAGVSRNGRKTTRTIRFQFYIRTLASGQTLTIQPQLGKQWSNDRSPLNLDQNPATAKIEYAASYYNAATGLESDLSPAVFSALLPPVNDVRGAYVTLTAAVSAELTNTDKVYFYRRDKKSGVFHRLPNIDGTYGVLNTGTPSLVDVYLESEIASLPQFGDGQIGLSTSELTSPGIAIGTWHQCLVVASRRQSHTSWIGQPFRFAPSPDTADAEAADDTDPLRGRTDYVADNRAEEVYGVAGQESLYAVTSHSSYAMTGDSPSDASSFRRMPGSRGALGLRATLGYGGGVEVGSQDGLWYYSVGRGFRGEDANGQLNEREETSETRRSWASLRGSSYSGLVLAEYNNEIWAFNGTAYMCLTRQKKWTSGTLADSVQSCLVDRVRGFMLLDSKGRMLKLDSTYTTDNGTVIAWNYETGWLEAPERMSIKGIEIQGSGTPSLLVYIADGAKTVSSPKTFTKVSGKVKIANVNISPGLRYKLKFTGASASDTVENCVLIVSKAPEGQNI